MKLRTGTGEKPLWSQLYSILEEEILSEKYKMGDLLPSEKELLETYDVSRVTVRQAMDKLIVAGLISRKRGKGTVVIKNDSTVATSFQSSFGGVKEKNNANDRRVIGVTLVIPPKEVQNHFHIDSSVLVIKLIRQTFIDNLPVTHYETYLNPITGLSEKDDYSQSMYQLLDAKGFRITSVNEKITAYLSDEEDKVIFKSDSDFAIMKRIRKGFSNDIPIEYTFSKYLAEGYELEINLS